METTPYQLYAFEYYVQHLKTDFDLANMRVEVRLFHSPYAVIKSKMYSNQSLWVMKSKYLPPEKEFEDEQEDRGPFILDFKSMSTVAEAEESHLDEEEAQSGDEVYKMASYDPCKPPQNNVTDGRSKEKDAGEPATEIIPQDAQGEKSETQDSGTRDSISLEDNRSQLRMFPEDPTGMPYNKVRKGQNVSRKSVDGEEKTMTNKLEKEDLSENSPPKTEDVQRKSKQDVPVEYQSSFPGDGEGARSTEKPFKECPYGMKSDRDFSFQPGYKEKIVGKNAESLPSDIFESGITIMLPMKPLKMIYSLQRVPLHVRVRDEENRFGAEAFLDLWPLFECVVRAERGPPTPVTSSCEVALQAHGDFEATLYSVVRLHAFGTHSITKIKSPEENPNDEMNKSRPPERPEYTNIDNDIHKAPPVLSGPEVLPRYPQKKAVHIDEEIMLAKKEEDDFFEENIVFCPIHRMVTPQAKDDYETLRWKIDKLIGITDVSIEEYKLPENETMQPEPTDEDEIDELKEWYKNKKKESRSRQKESRKRCAKTRSILQMILMPIEKPDPIKSSPNVLETGLEKDDQDVSDEEIEISDAKKPEQLTENEQKIKKAKFMYDEIRRHQEEEKMIKHYKRVFRQMLRLLEIERGLSPDDQRRREKERKYMKDLLVELETYSAEDVQMAYIRVVHGKGRAKKKWELDTWPSMVEEEEEEEHEESEEEEEDFLKPQGSGREPDTQIAQPGNEPNVPDEITEGDLILEESESELDQAIESPQ